MKAAAAAAAAAAATATTNAFISLMDAFGVCVIVLLIDYVFMGVDGIIESKQKSTFHKTFVFLVLFDARNKITMVFLLF